MSKNGNLGWRFIASLSAVFIVSVTSIIVMAIVGYNYTDEYKSLGPFGDFFGGVLNPILSFLAFIGVLFTVALPKVELNLTRTELERSANALENQNRSTDKQNFEASFFRMLTLHNSIVNSIDLTNSTNGNRIEGRDCFRTFYTRLTKLYRENTKKGGGKYSDERILSLSYKVFWKDVQLDLGHYYRYLFNIIKFIDESEYRDGYYIKLLRAQLSDQELLLLFYNCLSDVGNKFREYAEKFALFDNLPAVRLLNKGHRDRMAPSAFGQRAPEST